MKPKQLRAPLIFLGLLALPVYALATEQEQAAELPPALLQYLLEFGDENGELIDPLAIDAVMEPPENQYEKQLAPSFEAEKPYE